MSTTDDACVAAVPGRVLVVDRRPAVAEALGRVLRAAGVDADFATFEELTLDAQRTDTALLDADALEPRVVAVASALRAANPGVRVVLISTSAATRYELGVEAGASAVVDRKLALGTLVAALKGDIPFPRPVTVRASARLLSAGPVTNLEQLSAREREVLRHLMAGVPNGALAERLSISPHTVRTHVQNILGKLGVRSRLEAAAVGARAGLVPSGWAGEASLHD